MTSVAAPLPVGPGYAYEFKWDGMRALVRLDGRLQVFTRNGNEVAARFPELQELAQRIPADTVLDGEIVAFNSSGRPDFGRLQLRLGLLGDRDIARQVAVNPVRFIAFDVLRLRGHDVTHQPYTVRRQALRSLRLEGDHVAVPAHHDDGPATLAASLELGLEGVMAKRLDSTYLPGERSGAWVKVRNRNRQEFVVGGWTEGEGSRRGALGALVVGHYPQRNPRGQQARLVLRGKVGTGFNSRETARLMPQLRALATPDSPFSPSDTERLGDAHWVKPQLVAEIEFSGLASGGMLRQPSFKGLRTDKPPADVVWEQAEVMTWHEQSGADPSVSVW